MQLLKYNLRGMMSLCVPTYLLATLLAFFNVGLGFVLEGYEYYYLDNWGTILAVAYQFNVMVVFSTILVVASWVVSDFFKSVFGKEGYLTHTLPLKPSEILWSKVLSGTAVLWLTSLVIFLLYQVMALPPNGGMLEPILWYHYYLGEVIELVAAFLIAPLICEVLVLHCVFAAIALGHKTKHRVPWSIFYFFLLYNTFGNIPLLVALFFSIASSLDWSFWGYLGIYGFFAFVISFIFFQTTLGVMTKKLNLE